MAGDHLSIQASVGPDAHVVLSTPSANRIYRSLVGEARQTVRLSVASGGILEWFPEVTIPFADSRFVQTIDIRLAEGSTALIWDSLASGRVARGERWQFECLQNEIQITVASGSRLLERCEITPRQSHAGLALAYDYAASLFIACDAFDRKTWSLLREDLADVLDVMGDELLSGVTEPPVPGLAVKVVTRSAEGLAAVQAALWNAVRIRILGLPRPELRRY